MPDNEELKVKIAKGYFKASQAGKMDKMKESKKIIMAILKDDKECTDAKYVKAMHMDLENETAKAIKVMEEVVEVDESIENQFFLG